MRKISLLFVFFIACTRSDLQKVQTGAITESPEQVVRTFVSLSAGADSVEDRRKLQDLCVGELKRAFEAMSNEEFRLAYVDNHIKIQELKVLGSTTEDVVSHVRYTVTINNLAGTDPTHEINEREVELKLSQGAWYIEFIRLKGSDKIAFTKGMIF